MIRYIRHKDEPARTRRAQANTGQVFRGAETPKKQNISPTKAFLSISAPPN